MEDMYLEPPERECPYILCDGCKERLNYTDVVYEIEGERMCDDCAHEWLDNFKTYVDNIIERD